MMLFLLPVMGITPLAGSRSFAAAWPGQPDVSDLPIWATAKTAGARYVVSHNTRHFPPAVAGHHIYEGIEYLTAIEFVEQVLEADPEAEYGAPIPTAGILRGCRTA